MEQVLTLTCNNASLLGVTEVTISALGAFVRCRPDLDILPGKTWKCSMRSAFYWFAEFCHSQRLSHFAASFIVTRAEGSIAKSCKNKVLYNKKKFKIKSNRGYLLVTALPTDAGITATFESIHLRFHKLHALTVRFRFKMDYLSCKWSFRRFTYGNLVTTSPSSKW